MSAIKPGASRPGDLIAIVRLEADGQGYFSGAAKAVDRYDRLIAAGYDARIIQCGDKWLVEEFYSPVDFLAAHGVAFDRFIATGAVVIAS